MFMPIELLFYIGEFCGNKESLYIALSCTDAYNLFNNRFVKSMSYKIGNDIYDFIYKMHKHSQSLKTIQINNLYNPHLWLPFYPTKIILQCSISDNINPQEPVMTEYLAIINYSKKYIKINFEKFPMLKVFKYHGSLLNKHDDIKKNCNDIHSISINDFLIFFNK
jgi:hypothetical protein